jgi:hypothetical protein
MDASEVLGDNQGRACSAVEKLNSVNDFMLS